MSQIVTGILSFPRLFKPHSTAPGTPAKFSAVLILPAGDPQIAVLQQQQEQAILNQWPSGAPGGLRKCFQPYDERFGAKDYYDARMSGAWVLSLTAKAEDRPAVVDEQRQPLIDTDRAFSGSIVHVAYGMSAYTVGNIGVGGWLNGVMVTGKEGPWGRLDGKPTVDQMFAAAPVGAAVAAPVVAAPIAAPNAVAAPAAPAPAKQMTPAAQFTYQQYREAGWSDEQLIAQGFLVPPVAAPSWA